MTTGGPIVVAQPIPTGVRVCSTLAGTTPGGTLAWPAAGELREAADELAAIGWDALVVDPDDVALSTASMSHRAQIHGEAPVLVIAADDERIVAATIAVATMAARHLPALPVVITGSESGRLAAAWELSEADLELPAAAVVADGLASAVLAAIATSSDAHHRPHGNEERTA